MLVFRIAEVCLQEWVRAEKVGSRKVLGRKAKNTFKDRELG